MYARICACRYNPSFCQASCPSFDSYDLIQLDLSSRGIVTLQDISPPKKMKKEEIMEHFQFSGLKMMIPVSYTHLTLPTNHRV